MVNKTTVFSIGALAIGALAVGGFLIMKPRGIRNNNPGNIRGNDAYSWQGEIDRDNDNFVVFDTPENGLRALARILKTYREKYGLNTIDGILHRYAPTEENDTEAYIKHASRVVGVGRYAPLMRNDYLRLMQVIVAHENGEQPYTQAQIAEGFSRGMA
jgi:hypothetical protein